MSDTPVHTDSTRLSAAATARKDQILGELHTHLRSRTRRRNAVRTASASGVAALALAITLFIVLRPAAPAPDRGGLVVNPPQPPDQPRIVDAVPGKGASIPLAPSPAAPSRVTVRIAKSEPINAAPCQVEGLATVCILSDEQLLAALAEAGQPSGLVRTGGEAYIVPIGSSATPR